MSTPFDDPGEAARFAAYRINQMAEYGTWVAAGHIHINGVLGYTEGHPVPVSAVTAHRLDEQGQVVAAGTPMPGAGELEAARKRVRLAQLDAERAAIAAELDDGSDDAGDENPHSPAPQGEPTTTTAGRRAVKNKE